MPIDATHAPQLASWVESARDHAVFPLQNLPFGVFSRPGEEPRGGVAIGDEIFDVKAALDAGVFPRDVEVAAIAAAGRTLNALLALNAASRRALRREISNILAVDGGHAHKMRPIAARVLHPAAQCELHLPVAIHNYTDFYAGIYHAENGGRMRGLARPLAENYKYIPVAYHGRASSISASGVAIRRPNGQSKAAGDAAPRFGPSQKLDFELELGIWIGPGNERGSPIPIGEAGEHIAGFCLLNDWTARDVQGWEMAPLGPFLSKNFGTTVSPWIVTAEALAPFRIPQPQRAADDPQPLPYLFDAGDQREGAIDVGLDVLLSTEAMRAKRLPPHPISTSNAQHLYWTVAQMVAYHASGGCNLVPGDLFGSGTISGPTTQSFGSIREISEDGKRPIRLPSGETRSFIEDGDEVILRATARREGYRTLGFGDCRARVLPSPA